MLYTFNRKEKNTNTFFASRIIYRQNTKGERVPTLLLEKLLQNYFRER